MAKPSNGRRKVVVVGAGAVGSTFCYALAQSGLADEIGLLDQNQGLAQGQVLDLAHGRAFFPTVDIHMATPDDYADAQVVVVTAGAKQRPGQSRLDLLRVNAAIVRAIVDDLIRHESAAVLVIVTNPVDVLTHVACRRAGWPRGRVLGSGTVLDSARFRHTLAEHCRIDVHNIHAYVLGEHGDSEVAAWSMTHVAGIPIDRYCTLCDGCDGSAEQRRRIERSVRESAYHIIDYKGATCHAVGLALVRVVGAVLRDEHVVLTVSTMLEGEFGLNDVCLSVPSIVGRQGVERVLEPTLSPDEQAALAASAAVLHEAINGLEEAGG